MKAASFLANGIVGGYTARHGHQICGDRNQCRIGEYILSIYDASWSTKEINQQGLRKHKHKHVNGAPPQMLIGSYNARF